MIVTCENCNTNFELDDDRVSELGSDVTCSKCNHEFTVYGSSSLDEPGKAAEETAAQSLDLDLADLEEEPGQGLDLDLSDEEDGTGQGLDLDLADLEEEPGQGLDLDLSDEEDGTEQSLDLDLEDLKEEPGQSLDLGDLDEDQNEAEVNLHNLDVDVKAPAKGFTAGEEELDLDALSRALEEEDQDDDGHEERDGVLNFEMLDEEEIAPAPKELNLESISEEKGPEAAGFAGLQKPADNELPDSFELEDDPADAFSKDTSRTKLGGSFEEEPEEIGEPMKPPPVTPKMAEPKRRAIGAPVMIFLVVGLLAATAFGGYGLLMKGNVRIPFVDSIAGVQDEVKAVDPGNLQISLPDRFISSEYVNNEKAGRLFLIRGKARNDYSGLRNFIVVKAALFGKDGREIEKKKAYCGNVLSEGDLEALDKLEIDAKMANKFGHERSNFSIPPGKEIPFQIVFADVPADLGEFAVEVVSSLPGE
jgi:predicted Zn finger-like uncharacterized protein